MLARILEPEVMDTPKEAHDYDAMDHSAVNTLFVSDLLKHVRGDGPFLDLGTGTAQIPIELCRQHPTASVHAIDLAEHMLRLAEENVRRANLQDRIRIQKVDAKGLPFPDGSFAAVISNSIIHHIPDPASGLAEIVRVTQTGGAIFVRDLLRPADEAHLQSLVQVYAGDANPHQRKMFADSLHAALTLDEIRQLVHDVGMNPDDVTETSDRHWTWAGRVMATPGSTNRG